MQHRETPTKAKRAREWARLAKKELFHSSPLVSMTPRFVHYTYCMWVNIKDVELHESVNHSNEKLSFMLLLFVKNFEWVCLFVVFSL